MQKTITGHLMTMHAMFPNSCGIDHLTAGGCRECHSSAANEDGYDILWYRSGTLDRRTCLVMSFHFPRWDVANPRTTLPINDLNLVSPVYQGWWTQESYQACTTTSSLKFTSKNQQCALVMCPIQTMTSSSLMGKNNLGIVCRIRPLRRQKLSE